MVEMAGQFRSGVRVGVDVGDVRVGVARTDPAGILATPLETITGQMPQSIDELTSLIEFENPLEVIVGLPRSLSGSEGRAAQKTRAYASALAEKINVPVRVIDERLTTVSAHQAMHTSGRPGRKHRRVVDQVAAVMILQQALEIERSTHMPPGELVGTPTPAVECKESEK